MPRDLPTGNTCPVCGYDDLINPPYTEAGGSSYEICYCYGFEYGYTDDNSGYTFAAWRQRWIDAGMPWDWGKSDDRRPPRWDAVEQLRTVQGDPLPE